MKKIIIAGGSGFIGKNLSLTLSKNYLISILSRRNLKNSENINYVYWDGQNVSPNLITEFENAYAIVNLAGENINTIFTEENQAKIINSRIDSVKLIAEIVQQLENPPEIWIQASAIGFYGNSFTKNFDESSELGEGFLAEVCQKWESEFNSLELKKTTKAILRIGNVLGKNGGMLKPLMIVTKMFLGGASGKGNQFLSWIHIEDLVRIIEFILSEKLNGVYNAVAPNPVTNIIFMKTLRSILKRPWSPPVPSFILKIMSPLIGTDSELIFASANVQPKAILEKGFRFKFSNLSEALSEIIN